MKVMPLDTQTKARPSSSSRGARKSSKNNKTLYTFVMIANIIYIIISTLSVHALPYYIFFTGMFIFTTGLICQKMSVSLAQNVEQSRVIKVTESVSMGLVLVCFVVVLVGLLGYAEVRAVEGQAFVAIFALGIEIPRGWTLVLSSSGPLLVNFICLVNAS